MRMCGSRWRTVARKRLRLVRPVGASGRARARRRADRRKGLLLGVERLIGRLVALLRWAVWLGRSRLRLGLSGLSGPLVARLAGLAILLRVLVSLSVVRLRLLWA